MRNSRVFKLALASVFIALTFVVTYLIKVPLPLLGYVNVGDAVVALAALVGGPVIGALAGAVGSALADIVAGYVIYAPFTFIIKGIEGALVGMVFVNFAKVDVKQIVLMALAMLVMPIGYFISEAMILPFIDQTFGLVNALSALPFNMLQYIVCVIISVLIIVPFGKQLYRFRKI